MGGMAEGRLLSPHGGEDQENGTDHDCDETNIQPARLADHETAAEDAQALQRPDGAHDDQKQRDNRQNDFHSGHPYKQNPCLNGRGFTG